ncbi:MAG: penicillin-binding protein 1C [Bacteroidales bacterium]|nr:penicillin-binding protein 1C [Bacteroidales bacterium]
MLKRIKSVLRKVPVKVRYAILPVIALFMLFKLLDTISPVNTTIEYSTIIYSQDSTLIHGFLSYDDKWRMYTELEEITPELKKAIIFKEDKYFYYHYGINPIAIGRALFNNIKSGKRTSGASTITMQVARLIDPKSRTYGNKIIEMFRATQLEWHFTKDEILQLYLNLVPYGSNIEGVKSASIIYLGKLPNHLSIGEIAALSIIPNRPVSLKLGKNNEFIKSERNTWLLRYKKNKLFKNKDIEDALEEPLNAYRREVPKIAPHLSYRLKKRYPGRKIIYSSLDFEMQKKIEAIVKNYSQGLYFQNIKNAICLIVENETRQVKAYIGSADFFNEEDGGQVDGIMAIRSPGSTLKPLLYGIAMDRGLITPKSCISDVPLSLSGYEPENYDGEFYGNVSIEFALSNSLNVPAVKVLAELESQILIEKLIDINFKQIKHDRNNLGLSLILGGCGATLEELTLMFSSFANEGIYKRPQYVLDSKSSSGTELLSKESSFMITDILTQLTRPDLPLDWANSQHMPKIGWKTGTSYGRRDAWSIGYNKKYTVGTWVGNFSGEGVPELSGAEKASPLLFKVFNAIDYNSEAEWFHTPANLSFRAVCPETGLIPSENCESDIIDYFIPGVSSMKICEHNKEVPISIDSTISYCTSCKPKTGYIEAEFPNLPAEMITYYETNNVKYLKIPPHNNECERLMSGNNPVIISPINENEYYVDIEDEMQIMLSSHAANDVEKIYWYINNKFYKAVNPGEKIFFEPSEGKVQISCSDDKGRNTNINIYVKYISF